MTTVINVYPYLLCLTRTKGVQQKGIKPDLWLVIGLEVPPDILDSPNIEVYVCVCMCDLEN